MFLILIVIGMPVAFVLGISGLTYILISGQYSFLINIPQTLVGGINKFSLLAIPFYILVAELMNAGGVTKHIVNFFRKLIGHFVGGLSYVNIVVSAFLSSIVGSVNAVAAITSTSIVPEMRKDGYENSKASALSAASAIMGPIIPPSMVLIIFGVSANTSVGDLFIAGIIPGIMLAVAFFVIAYISARKNLTLVKHPRPKLYDLSGSFIKVLPALSIPMFILIGIIKGVFTPTEAGAVGCLIALILGVFVYKQLTWSTLLTVLFRTGTTTGSLLIIMSTASLFSWVLARERIPQQIADILLSISEEHWVILLLINIFLLFVGLFLDAVTAIIILVPVFLPVILEIGIDPIHFGIFMTLNLVIGLITPPVGISLFIVSSITKVSVYKLSIAVLPYVIASIIVLLVIVYIPELSTWLPSLLRD